MPLRRGRDGKVAVLDRRLLLSARQLAEARMVDLRFRLGAFGVHGGVPEYRFDPDRRMRFDLAWPQHRVALEVDGGIWTHGRHVRPRGFLRDHAKRNAAARLGWRMLFCTWDDAQPSRIGTLAKLLLDTLAWPESVHRYPWPGQEPPRPRSKR